MFRTIPIVIFLPGFLLIALMLVAGFLLVLSPDFIWKLRERNYKMMGLAVTKPSGWDKGVVISGVFVILSALFLIVSFVVRFK